ncbi:MAG: DNA methylase [Thermoplasmata archaeon]|nr:DNA methylase [Candidatus Sysuiplasma acidicola]
MQEVTRDDYFHFIKDHDSVSIEEVNVKLVKRWKIDAYQPKKFTPEEWTVWSFPDRGDWATHAGNYRGNWSPFIPRNLILKFTKPGELVCDPMMGSGTTLVECKLTQRDGIGVDINPNSVMVAMNRLDFHYQPLDEDFVTPKIKLFVGDARYLNEIPDESVDLVSTHPPYAGIISYSKSTVLGDLSSLNLKDFIDQIGVIAKECMRILKPGRYCAILIGDTRKHKHYVPISVGVLNEFLDAGFVLKEDIIKLQHNTLTARNKWSGHTYDFYKIGHEHLYIFRKLDVDEKKSEFKNSVKWW